MNAKILLALALVAALVALASPFYINDDLEDDEMEGGAVEELQAQALPLFLQKRGRGSRYIRCFDEDTGAPCKCDRSRSRGLHGSCKK